jgi:eukaryotic-like serine/threonine-protein kinase
VSRFGDSVRVNYVLVDTATLRQLDAYSMTATGDPFSIQDRVAEWAVKVLALNLSASERARLTTRGTQVPGAYEFYLQGLGYLLNPHSVSNVDNAIQLFERTLALDPQYVQAYAGLGRAQWLKYEATKNVDWVARARESCDRAVALESGSPAAHLCVGTLEFGAGNYRRAVDAFTTALAGDVTSDVGYIGLARAYEGLGDLAKAEDTYKRAVALQPQYWAAYDRLGNFYRERARYGEAATQFEAEVALTPDNPKGYLSLGAVYALIGRYDEALTAINRSAQLSPTFSAYTNLGMVLFRLRRFDDAAAALKRAQTLRPGEFRTFGNLARVYHWIGQRSAARDLYLRAVELGEQHLLVNPHDVDAHLLLADFAAKLGRRAEALKHLDAAEPITQNPHQVFFVAIVHNQLGDEDRALAYLNQAVARGLPLSELHAWIEFDNIRDDPRFQALVNR